DRPCADDDRRNREQHERQPDDPRRLMRFDRTMTMAMIVVTVVVMTVCSVAMVVRMRGMSVTVVIAMRTVRAMRYHDRLRRMHHRERRVAEKLFAGET